MKGPRELKLYTSRFRAHLKACPWDDLAIFKLERCKKWRKAHRRSRDGSGERYRPLASITEP